MVSIGFDPSPFLQRNLRFPSRPSRASSDLSMSSSARSRTWTSNTGGLPRKNGTDFWIDQDQRGIGDFKTRDLDIRCVHKVWGVNQQEPLRFQHLNENCSYQKWDFFSAKSAEKLCHFTVQWIDVPVQNLHEFSGMNRGPNVPACWLDDWIRSLSLRKPSFLQMGWTNYGYENHLIVHYVHVDVS